MLRIGKDVEWRQTGFGTVLPRRQRDVAANTGRLTDGQRQGSLWLRQHGRLLLVFDHCAGPQFLQIAVGLFLKALLEHFIAQLAFGR